MQSKLGKWGLCSEDETYRLKSDNMQIYSKESLIQKLEELANKGWIKNERKGNDGAVGNTLEDYLGITENNLPIPNAAEWELKAHRSTSTALITLLHLEPSPQGLSLVSNMLLPNYGWKHQKSGIKYPESEMSFRQTITCPRCSDRGFRVVINRDEKKVEISFDSSCIDERKHAEWKSQVNERVGLNELNPQPYWGFSDLEHAIGAKLHNCFYVVADVKSENGNQFFWYNKVLMLRSFSFEKFLTCLENGTAFIDFDARTGHNHGTKLRIRGNLIPELYTDVTTIIDIK